MFNGKHFLNRFLRLESLSGIILCLITLFTLVLANSSYDTHYLNLLNYSISSSFFFSHLNLNTIINDGLMSIFFLLVSLEIKREILVGQLAQLSNALLPLIAAIGGILIPTLLFLLITHRHEEYIAGWAIPTATDIAFSLGILSLVGTKIPRSLKIFLMALAIIDDLFAIVIIAFFYTQTLHLLFLLLAGVSFVFLLVANALNYRNEGLYLFLGLLLWVFILKSGVQPTIAGVLLGLSLPFKGESTQKNIVSRWEKHLDPWVAFLVLPLFAFANAGLSFKNIHLITLANPLCLGIIGGLFFGKQLGIFLFTWLSVHLKFVKLPLKVSWTQLYGIALLCGVGFTMSLFIGSLAFSNVNDLALVRLGVLCGSFLSAVLGYSLLYIHTR